MNPVIAFDFSMNKPAMASFIDGNLEFTVWPLNIDDIAKEKLETCGITVINRNLSPIKDNTMNEHSLIYEHVSRAESLSDMIMDRISLIIGNKDRTFCYISNEGFSFGSHGDAILDLSGYKYILMSKLIKNGFVHLRTYAPITIKKIAGCSKKGMNKKENMINAMSSEDPALHPFIYTLKNSPEKLKKKTAYVQCVDDIVDAYWCLKTTIVKEF